MATNPALTQRASRGCDNPVVTGLVIRARNGEQQAWAGSIRPNRRRCLDKLRRHPAITALINADT